MTGGEKSSNPLPNPNLDCWAPTPMLIHRPTWRYPSPSPHTAPALHYQILCRPPPPPLTGSESIRRILSSPPVHNQSLARIFVRVYELTKFIKNLKKLVHAFSIIFYLCIKFHVQTHYSLAGITKMKISYRFINY
jgi:hypothetical protein